jgi:peptide chain release factor 2
MDLISAKQTFRDCINKLQEFESYINRDEINIELDKLKEIMNDAAFWGNQREAKRVIERNNYLKNKIVKLDEIKVRIEDIEVGIDLIEASEDESLLEETIVLVKELAKTIDMFEMELLLADDYDQKNAILEIHPGAGGTESQDWGDLLLRMYTRYAEDKNYKVEFLDYLPGEEAGIKSVTLLIKGENAYGFLKAEKGVHRLIRISPFDASGRRHTSFASIDVMPELDEEIEIEIKNEDIKIDTYRSSGAGGQHVNTTDSAIRITHIETGIVVTCQNERSQIANREKAMQMLKTKLYQLEIQKKQEELHNIRGEHKEIGWGSQIRTYVFHPYSMVKDHRTNVETGNIQAVMNGDIELFIRAYLKKNIKK